MLRVGSIAGSGLVTRLDSPTALLGIRRIRVTYVSKNDGECGINNNAMLDKRPRRSHETKAHAV